MRRCRGGAPAAACASGGTVVDVATGQPIDGAIVHVQPETGALQTPLQLTDAKGRFLIGGVQQVAAGRVVTTGDRATPS